MPLLWDDPFMERDMLNAKARVDAKFKSYQDFFKTPLGEQKGFNIIEATTAFPGLGKTPVVSVGMTIDNPASSKAVQDLNEEYSLSSVAEEASLWQELSEEHNAWGDEWEKNMAIAPIEFWTLGLAHPGPDGVYKSVRGRENLKNSKFGDIQYGVWAAQAWDGLMQNVGFQGKWATPLTHLGATGRSTSYVRDLIKFDYKRMTGKDASRAQSELPIDVRFTQVEGVGEWKGIGGQLSKYIDMFQEAHKLGGQTIVNAMWKEMHAGRPINFDRDKWMQFITLTPEEDPRYQDLITKHNYSPDRAKEIFYRYVGRPLKAADDDGEIHYTSLDNPASIYFFAGRSGSSKWSLGGGRGEFKNRFDTGELLLYSPGRYQASFLAPTGTKAFRNISGSIDFAYSLTSEIIGGKGTKGVGNLFKNLRRVNPLLNAADKSIDLTKGRKVTLNDAKSQGDEFLEEMGDSLDGLNPNELPDGYQGYLDSQTGLWQGLRSKYRHYRISTKDKREYTFLGKVPMIFRETKEELLSSPFQMKIYDSIIETVLSDKSPGNGDTFALLASNPIFRKFDRAIHQQINNHAKKQNRAGIQKIYGRLMDEGITIGKNLNQFDGGMLPRGAAFFRNKVSREMARAGKEIANKPNATRWQKARGKVLSRVGNENAAYKSIGSKLGQGLQVGTGTVIPGVLKTITAAPGASMRAVGLGVNAIRRPKQVRNALNKKGFKLFIPEDASMTVIDNSDEVVKHSILSDLFVPRTPGVGLQEGQATRFNKNFINDMKGKLQDINPFPSQQQVPFETYLGFSSNLYSNTNPYFRKIMHLTPDFAIKGLNKAVAREQLLAHLTVAGYDLTSIGQRLLKFDRMDWRKKSEISKFMVEQAGDDIAMVRKIKGDETADLMEVEIAEQFGMNQNKLTDLVGYFIGGSDEVATTMPHAGSGFNIIETHAIPDWKGVDQIVESGSGHLLSEFAENVHGFVDYRIIRKALGPLYTRSHEQSKQVYKTLKGMVGHSVEWSKYHYNWWDVNSNITPELTGVIHVKKFKSDWLSRLGDYYTRKVFKPLVLLRAAFLTRVFLEEQARFVMGNLDGFFNHPMHYIQWVTSGKKHRKLAIDMGNITGAQLDAVKLMQSYEHFEAIQKGFTLKGLLGRSDEATGALNFVRINKTQGLDNYVDALGFELLQLRNDPLARIIARHGHQSDEVATWLKSGAGQKHLQDIADWGGRKWSRITHDEDFIMQHVQSIEARIRMKTAGKLEKGELYQHARANQKYRYNITSSRSAAGSSDELIEFIATGDLLDLDSGKLITFIPEDATKGEIAVTNLWRKNKETLNNKLRRYVDSDTTTVNGRPGLNLDMGDLKQALEVEDSNKLGKKMDMWVNHMFTHLMTKPIGYLNRSVAFKQYRYQYLLSNWENIQSPARKRLIDEAVELGVPEKIIQEMRFLSESKLVKEGAMDFNTVNAASKSFGLTGTKNLLYDASKKHLVSDITRNIFPFPEIWFEVASTWTKLLADKPYAARNAHVAVRAGESYMTDGSRQRGGEGFITANPQNRNEKMFVWPFSGFLSSLVYGGEYRDPNVNPQVGNSANFEFGSQTATTPEWTETQVAAKAYLSGINLLGQGFVPGPNPMVAFALDKVRPTETWNAELKDTLFGGFLPPTKVMGGVIPAPPWFKKLAASVVNIDTDEDVNWEFEQMRAASTIQVYRYGMITGQNIKLYKMGKLDRYLNEIDDRWSEQDIDFNQKRDEAFLLYSKAKSGQLFAFQSLAQFMLPTGFQPTFYVKDTSGKTWHASVLADEYRKILLDNDNDDTAAAEDFINKYGLEHGWLTAPSKVTKGGRENYSYKSQKWKYENREQLRNLKLTSWLVLPENPAEKRASSDLIPDKTQLSPDEFRRNVNDTIGYFRYQNFINMLENLNLNSTQEIIAKRWYRNELILQLPGFQEDDWGLFETVSSKDMFREMRLKWLDNDTVMGQETGKGFAMMIEDWEEFEQVSSMLSPTKNPDWWLQSTDERAVYMRMLMNQQAEAIIRKYPDFFHVWTSVMLKLFRDDKELLMEMNY